MYSIPTPRRCDDDDYRNISATRQNATKRLLLATVEHEVISAYLEYDRVGGDPEKITQFSCDSQTSGALVGNFAALDNGRPYGVIRQEILLSARDGQCPMCGRGQVATLDHYLPKSQFPQFSIYSKNLIPTCHRCNFKKADTVGKSGGRFMHAYFDSIPDVQVLKVDAVVGDVFSLSYFLDTAVDVDPLVLQNIVFHFEVLDLASYYQAEAISELADRLEVLEAYYGPDGDAAGVRGYLSQEASSVRAAKGANHWKSALLGSLASHHGFCDGGFRAMSVAPTI